MMTEPCTQQGNISRLLEHSRDMDHWQKRQNGSLHRIEKKVDRLVYGLIIATLALTGNMILLIVQLLRDPTVQYIMTTGGQ